ncbi:hypothetical protein KP626_04235 [Christensenella sp. MSJ-20]|uniref:hypothetical protein n=1 Tax=Christensenella sp. MSJ-20 TaxID=2841518 RepID=UPI001C7568B1|nr:hypothetical protein KP626_04235 [Christensenella sp. MSJ-20]
METNGVEGLSAEEKVQLQNYFIEYEELRVASGSSALFATVDDANEAASEIFLKMTDITGVEFGAFIGNMGSHAELSGILFGSRTNVAINAESQRTLKASYELSQRGGFIVNSFTHVHPIGADGVDPQTKELFSSRDASVFAANGEALATKHHLVVGQGTAKIYGKLYVTSQSTRESKGFNMKYVIEKGKPLTIPGFQP